MYVCVLGPFHVMIGAGEDETVCLSSSWNCTQKRENVTVGNSYCNNTKQVKTITANITPYVMCQAA